MFLFFLLSFLEIIIFISISKNKNILNFLKNPILFFALMWIILYTILPIWQYYSGIYFYEESYSEYSYSISKLQSSIFYISTIIFSSFFNKNLNSPNTILNINYLKNNDKYFLIFMILIGFGSSYFFLKKIFGIGLINYMANRISLSRGLGIYSLFMYTSFISLQILFLTVIRKKKSNFYNLLFIILIFSTCSTFVLIGSRLSVIILLGILAIDNILTSPIFNFKKILIYFIGLIFIFSSLTFIGEFRNKIDRIDIKNYSGLDNTGKEIVVNFGKFENVLWLNDNIKKWDYSYGKTFLAGFTNFIPRIIWKSKPLGAGPLLKNYIVPFSYSIRDDYVSSYTTGLLTESIMNFGWFGLFIIPFFLSMSLYYLKKLLIKVYTNKSFIDLSIYVFVLFSVCFYFQFGEFLGSFTRTLFVIIPFILYKKIYK